MVTDFSKHPRRYGGYIVHVAMVFLFVGFAGAGFNEEAQKALSPGQDLQVGHYTLRLEKIESSDNDNYSSATGIIKISKNGQELSTLKPEQRFYKSSKQPTSEVALHRTLKEDLYVVFAGFQQEGKQAIIHAYVNPLVAWIWIGGLVFIIGTIICLIPNQHEQVIQKAQTKVEVDPYAKVPV